jgi:hypothetical protein
MPIKPILNWQEAPAYKVAKFAVQQIKQLNPLPISYNVTDSINLVNDLNNIDFSNGTKLCSFYITNVYTNIPTSDIIHIIKGILSDNNQILILGRKETLTLICPVQLSTIGYRQINGLAMETPTSAICAEIFL